MTFILVEARWGRGFSLVTKRLAHKSEGSAALRTPRTPTPSGGESVAPEQSSLPRGRKMVLSQTSPTLHPGSRSRMNKGAESSQDHA